MKLSEMLLPEFEQEMAHTRNMLERMPEDKLDYKPHEKSWSLGELATHLANLPGWTMHTLNQDSLHLGNADQQPRMQPIKSRQEALTLFETNVANAREAISGASDDQLMAPWSLISEGKTVFTLPRISVLRNFVMNHNIHHRAQLGLYLRLNDIPLPFIYGATADEQEM